MSTQTAIKGTAQYSSEQLAVSHSHSSQLQSQLEQSQLRATSRLACSFGSDKLFICLSNKCFKVYPVYSLCDSRKTLTGALDPTYMQPMNKPCTRVSFGHVTVSFRSGWRSEGSRSPAAWALTGVTFSIPSISASYCSLSSSRFHRALNWNVRTRWSVSLLA